MAVADRCTVLRKGKFVGTVEIENTSKEELSKMMVGRDVQFAVDKKPCEVGKPILEVENLVVPSKVHKNNAVRGVSFKGYGVSLALGVGVPIPILNPDILRRTTVRDRDIQASVIDYSNDYPQKTGKVLARFNYEQLRSGEVELLGKKVPVTSLSSYHKALEICNLLKAEIEAGRFLLSAPSQRLPLEQGMQSLNITGPAR